MKSGYMLHVNIQLVMSKRQFLSRLEIWYIIWGQCDWQGWMLSLCWWCFCINVLLCFKGGESPNEMCPLIKFNRVCMIYTFIFYLISLLFMCSSLEYYLVFHVCAQVTCVLHVYMSSQWLKMLSILWESVCLIIKECS